MAAPLGSAIEVRRLMGGRTTGFRRVMNIVKGKDWEIVAFSEKSFVIRVERENLELERGKGLIKQRVKLS